MVDSDRSLVSKALAYFAGALLCLVLSALTACGGAPADPVIDGRFVFRWKIVDYRAADPSNAPPISCASVGAAQVGLAWQLPSSSGGFLYLCKPEGYARTEPLPRGRYKVAAGLLDDRQAVISRIGVEGEQEVDGQDVDLGRFVFVVRPL